MDGKSQERKLVERVERATEIPMLVLAALFVVVFLIGYWPDTSTSVQRIAAFAEDVIVALFAVELLVRVAVAERRWAYLRAHWLDVLVVIVPFLRPLRFLRVVRILQLLRFVPLLLRGMRGLRRVMGRYHGLNVLTIGLVAVITSAVLVARFERDAGGSIHDFGDGLWWAAATVTTVGYGDATPVTPEGRAIAVFLMVLGITLFGILTASVAAYFVERSEQQEESQSQQLLARIIRLEEQLERQHSILLQLHEAFATSSNVPT